MKKKLKLLLCLVAAISLLVSNVTFAAPQEHAASEKNDKILVQTDATGKIKEKRVSVTITGANSTDPILDRTVLSDIINISGDESFKLNDDGTIVWENKGNPINYLGTLNEELPFTMKITYYLDDKEITPEELAGKSGHVKVIYSFENLVTMDVEMDGEIYNTYLPLMAITSIIIPMENFSNVDSLDGGLVVEEFGDQYFLLGVANAGGNEALNLEIM